MCSTLKEIVREHEKLGFARRFGAGLPRVNDGALLFLQHMVSKFEPVNSRGGDCAVVEVGDGVSIFFVVPTLRVTAIELSRSW